MSNAFVKILLPLFFCFILNSQTFLPDSLKRELKRSGDTVEVLALKLAGDFFNDEGEPDSALVYFEKAAELSKKLNFERGVLISYRGISDAYVLNEQVPEAIDFLLRIFEIHKKNGNKKNCASTCMNMGHIYLTHSNYPEALRKYLEFLRLAEEINDETQIARAHGCIGMVYMKQKDHKKALDHFFITVKIQERLDKTLDLSKTYNFIANAFDEMEKHEEALKYHEVSLKLKEKIGDEEGVGVSYQNMAGALTDLKRYDEALKYFEKAMVLHRKFNREESMIRTYISLSKLYVMTDQIQAAEDACLEALKLDNGADMEIGFSIHENLSHIYALKKDYAKALVHFKKYVSLRDSLLNEENLKKSVTLEMSYEFEKKEAQTRAEQEKRDAISKAERKKQKLIIWSVLVILVLVLFFAVYAYRSYLEKRRTNREITSQKEIIEQKQKEILDSIHYARRIQSSLMSSETYVDRNLKRLKD